MPNYTAPDLSGILPEYHVDTYQRMIYKSPQKLEFKVPVFENDLLEVILLGTVPTPLIKGADWIVEVDDIHDDAISVAKSIDPAFDDVLLKSVTIIRSYAEDYSVQLKFNQLTADVISYARLNSLTNDLEVTPTLVSNMIEQIEYLQQMILNADDSYSEQSSFAKILNIDTTGEDPANLIEDEEHDINTFGAVQFINCIYGAFYEGNLILKNGQTDEIINPENYKILEPDLAKTRNSSHPSGVYRSIKLEMDFVGIIKVTYQAYGGSTDILSMNHVKDRINIIEGFLSGNSFITPNTLHADPVVIRMLDKIQSMEGQMRLLLQNGLPSYGDVTTNTSVLKKITAADDLKHWWSIASLYRVDGSNENVVADVFKFRIKTLHSNMMFECSVAVNLAESYVGERFQVTCNNSSLPRDVLTTTLPTLRLIGVREGGIYTGVVLQIGMNVGQALLQETLAIEDISGKESCWILVPFQAPSINPEDSGVLMPDGVSVYTPGGTHSFTYNNIIPFNKGINFLRHDTNVAIGVTPYEQADVFVHDHEHVLQEVGGLEFTKASSIKAKFTLNIGGTPYDIDTKIPMSYVDKVFNVMGGDCIIRTRDNGHFRVAFYLFVEEAVLPDTGFNYTIRVDVRNLRDELVTDTFNLRGAKLLFDQ